MQKLVWPYVLEVDTDCINLKNLFIREFIWNCFSDLKNELLDYLNSNFEREKWKLILLIT